MVIQIDSREKPKAIQGIIEEFDRQGIVHPALKNQAFYTRTDHKILGLLRPLSCLYLGRKILDRVLCLSHFRSKEGILFEARLVLDDDHRNTHAL